MFFSVWINRQRKNCSFYRNQQFQRMPKSMNIWKSIRKWWYIQSKKVYTVYEVATAITRFWLNRQRQITSTNKNHVTQWKLDRIWIVKVGESLPLKITGWNSKLKFYVKIKILSVLQPSVHGIFSLFCLCHLQFTSPSANFHFQYIKKKTHRSLFKLSILVTEHLSVSRYLKRVASVVRHEISARHWVRNE